MLDDIFSIDNFQSEIIWKRSRGAGNSCKSRFYCEHDVILFYTKTKEYTFNPIYNPLEDDSAYNKIDKDGRRYHVKNPDGKRRKKRTIFYLDEQKGVPIKTIWDDISGFNSKRKGYTGYPTQKPIELYQRIINASSNKEDLVLDPFMGSGTTIEAAQSLDRKFIGIDQNPNAIKTCQQRLDNYAMFLEYKTILL